MKIRHLKHRRPIRCSYFLERRLVGRTRTGKPIYRMRKISVGVIAAIRLSAQALLRAFAGIPGSPA